MILVWEERSEKVTEAPAKLLRDVPAKVGCQWQQWAARSPVVTLALVLGGCGLSLPEEYPLAAYTEKQLVSQIGSDELFVIDDPQIERKIRDILHERFPPPWSWEFTSGTDRLDMPRRHLYRGFELHQRHCLHCHGISGGGDGPTAPFLNPPPRDYRRGIFKWKSTVPNAKPTREDLTRLIADGAVGTSMPPFRLMIADDLSDMVDYVLYLSQRGELERRLLMEYALDQVLLDSDEIDDLLENLRAAWANAPSTITRPKSPAPMWPYASQEFGQSLARGKASYLGEAAACYKCHGKDGTANPADWASEERNKMIDDWGNPNYPNNLRLGLFRGGRRAIDIYRRVHDGIKGTQMPEQSANRLLGPGDMWDLVNFVRALHYQPNLLAEARPTSEHSN